MERERIAAAQQAPWVVESLQKNVDAKRDYIVELAGINKELLAACRDVDKFYQDNFEIMPVAFQTIADIVEAAIQKAGGNQ